MAFLEAVRAADSDRLLIVLADNELGQVLKGKNVTTVTTGNALFSPWPRDPMTLFRDPAGGVVVLVRPDSQWTREADAQMGEILVEGLSKDLKKTWGGLQWRMADVPFHNGQLLDTGKKLWLSLHSVEPRALALASYDRVPVSAFAGPPGARYINAVRLAADELGALYGREPAFVHPLPESSEERAAAANTLGGGAGFDLDSLLTLLTVNDGLVALVADIDAGRRLVATASDKELAQFATRLDLHAEGLRSGLLASQGAPRAQALDDFLESVARHLATQMAVRRLPLLIVRRELQRDRSHADSEFLVGWNNVVLDGRERAEGFRSALAPGDELARGVFAELGYELELLPMLRASVLGNGGYRCASQHLR